MTLTATYANDLARIRLAVTGAPARADYALFERSTDQIVWTQVRGGQTVGLTGGACALDDYEFTAGVLNYYRVSYVDTGTIAYTAGAVSTGNNTSLTPALPTGATNQGDTLYLFASIRNTSASVNTPTGYTLVADGVNVRVFSKRAGVSETAPTVSFTGGAAGDSTTAVVIRYVNASATRSSVAVQANGSAQNVAYPTITAPASTPAPLLALALWKQAQPSTWTPVTGGANLVNTNNTAGSGDSFVWMHAPGTSLPAGTVTVTGGSAAVSKAVALGLVPAEYVIRETASCTPAMTRLWIKNVLRPNLNFAPIITEFSDITRPSKSGSFPVVGRTLEVAVTDVAGSRRQSITIATAVPGGSTSLAAADALDAQLASGEVLFIHAVDTNSPIPTMYAVLGQITRGRPDKHDSPRRYFTLPLTEVAAPDATLIGDTILYADLPGVFATYADIPPAEPTYSDLASRIADGSQVIVP